MERQSESKMHALNRLATRWEASAERVQRGFFNLIGFAFIASVLALLLDAVAEHTPLSVQIAALTVFGMAISWLFWGLAAEHRRARIFDALSEVDVGLIGRVQPIMFLMFVLIMVVAYFSAFTFVLYDHGAFELRTAGGHPVAHAGQLGDFYLWHFLDIVPALEINKTLGTHAPVTYTAHGVGWLLLLFKIIGVFFIVQGFIAAWKFVTGQGTDSPFTEESAPIG
jgi:hypothetical protein